MQIEREHPCATPDLPEPIARAAQGYSWLRDTVGESGGAVYRLTGKTGAGDLYLKHGEGPLADDLMDEAVRLRWLGHCVPAPRVVQVCASSDATWLLMTALPGRTAWQTIAANPHGAGAVVDAMAAFLRQLHAISPESCPFISDHPRRLCLARQRIDAGLVDEDDFDEARMGWSAQQVWQALEALLPLVPDPVVTHGDFSLDNILVEGGAITGCIDAGRAGIADRYQDIAIAWNCLGEFGPELQNRFLSAYGLQSPDREKLEFHLLLDELF